MLHFLTVLFCVITDLDFWFPMGESRKQVWKDYWDGPSTLKKKG